MDTATNEQGEVVFQELRDEFSKCANEFRTAVVKQGKTPPVEHVSVQGLPLLGKTHACVGNGLVHVAAVLGLRLPGGEGGGAEAELVAGGAEAETYRCCQLVEQVLRSCGVGWGGLVRLTVHVPNLTANKLDAIEGVIDRFYVEKDCPLITKTAVGCSSLRLSASVQMEGVALLPDSELSRVFSPPPGLERMPDSPPLSFTMPTPLQRQISENLSEMEDEGGVPTTARKQQGKWLVMDVGEEQRAVEHINSASSEPAQEPAPEGASPEAGNAAEACERNVRQFGLVGQVAAVHVAEVGLLEVRRRRLHFQLHHDSFREVEMLMSETYRTVRLDPREVACLQVHQQFNWGWGSPMLSVWSYTFDVAVTRTSNSFMNIGLVEWVASTRPPPLDGMGKETTLAQLVGACDTGGMEPWQHLAEDSRQVMLGCRRGTKWYGNSIWEHLFKDDICEGSLLQFLCEFSLDPGGVMRSVRLWLLPSPVIFRKRGWQCVQLARPVCEWVPPPIRSPDARSLWVPAVTLYNQQDAVVLSWRRGVGGRP